VETFWVLTDRTIELGKEEEGFRVGVVVVSSVGDLFLEGFDGVEDYFLGFNEL
jgi:hypothetical protein